MDRRDVLIAGGIAAASLGSAARAAPARKLGIAIVGLGYYGTQIIMPRFADCKTAKLAGLVSGDRAKALKYAAQYGIPERSIYDYKTYERMRDNPEIDAVYVILPNSMHAEYTVRAAKAGKHVLCEKPMANTVAECEAMIAACRAAGKTLMIGYRSHFEPHNLAAMKLARDGTLGRMRLVGSEHGFVQGDPSKWRLKKALAGGGALMDMGIYSLQAARYMTGEEPTSVFARESTDRRDPRFHEVDDLMEWTLTFPSGAMAACTSSYSSNQNHIRATGDKGWVDLEPATSYAGQRMLLKTEGDPTPVTPPPGPGANMWAAQMDHFAECALSGAKPIVGGDEGLRDLRIVEAIYRSAANGRVEKV